MTLTSNHINALFFSIFLTFYLSATPSDESGKNDSLVNYYFKLAKSVSLENPELAQNLMDSAVLHTNSVQNPKLNSRITDLKGRLYLKAGKYPDAIQAFQKSIATYDEIPGQRHNSAYVQIEIGSIFYQLHQYEEAIKLYERTIPLFGFADAHHKNYGRALAINNIGLCYTKLNKPNEAYEAFLEALNLRKSIDDASLIAHSYSYLAMILVSKGEFAKADSLIEMGLSTPNLSPKSKWHNKLIIERASLLIGKNQFTEARVLLDKTASEIHKNEQEELYTDIYKALYSLEKESGNYNEALSYANHGYDYALKHGQYYTAIDFAQFGKDISIQIGDLKKVLYYTEQISIQKDSFIKINSEVLKDLMTLSIAMEATQKENSQLHTTKNSYSATIDSQQGLLVASITLIMLLVLIAVIFINLNKKLKKNQRDQRELNLRILAVINRTESLILSLDSNGVIRVINKPAMRFFLRWVKVDLKAGDNILEKLNGTPAFEAWSESIKKSIDQAHWKEVTKFNVNGKTYYFLENFSSISHQNGEYAGLVMVSNDITNEHEFNVQMTEQNDSLEKSNKAKERMLSILAHDLKDAVYSAHSLSELVLETPDEFPKEELLHLFSLLHGNFDKTKSLLNGLLDWMKAQTGALEMKKAPINLNHLVTHVLDASLSKAKSKGIKLQNSVNDNLEIIGDLEMIKTILRNLVSNSLKYTEPNKGVIEIIAEQEGSIVSIHVVDNGQGISKENQLKLFQGPGQFTTVGTAKEQGTGFGLSLCQELVELHNSTLRVNSQEGVGTDFYFSLPLNNDVKDDSKKAVV